MTDTANLGFIHHFIPSPAGATAPTLLLLHGTGGDESDLLSIGNDLLPAAHILSPRGKVLEQGMHRWFRRFAVGKYDLEDLRIRTNELATFIVTGKERYNLNQSAVVAVGYSNGANIAANLVMTRPDLLNAAILLRPSLNIDISPIPNLNGLPLFLASGDRDPYGGRKSAVALAEQLTSFDAKVTVRHHPGGHELTDGDIEAAASWLSKSLGAL